MSIFRTDPPLTRSSDEAVARYLEALRPSLEPDPLFKRRLRGVVVNQFVAAREGLAGHPGTPRRSSQMGRIGRASLVASLALAASVGSVMAASQGAIPGDLLYPLKRQVESLRVRILPPDLQDELAAYVLTERVSELGRLADAGEWALAATLTEPIAAAIAELESLGGAADVDGVLGAQLQALNGIVSRMPAATRGDVEVALSLAEPPPAGAGRVEQRRGRGERPRRTGEQSRGRNDRRRLDDRRQLDEQRRRQQRREQPDRLDEQRRRQQRREQPDRLDEQRRRQQRRSHDRPTTAEPTTAGQRMIRPTRRSATGAGREDRRRRRVGQARSDAEAEPRVDGAGERQAVTITDAGQLSDSSAVRASPSASGLTGTSPASLTISPG